MEYEAAKRDKWLGNEFESNKADSPHEKGKKRDKRINAKLPCSVKHPSCNGYEDCLGGSKDSNPWCEDDPAAGTVAPTSPSRTPEKTTRKSVLNS